LTSDDVIGVRVMALSRMISPTMSSRASSGMQRNSSTPMMLRKALEARAEGVHVLVDQGPIVFDDLDVADTGS
jgi:hypothetical protein